MATSIQCRWASKSPYLGGQSLPTPHQHRLIAKAFPSRSESRSSQDEGVHSSRDGASTNTSLQSERDIPENPPNPTPVLTIPTPTSPTPKVHPLNPRLDIHLNHLLNGESNFSAASVLLFSLSALCLARSCSRSRSGRGIPRCRPPPPPSRRPELSLCRGDSWSWAEEEDVMEGGARCEV